MRGGRAAVLDPDIHDYLGPAVVASAKAEQCDGRILRQGNTWPEVEIHRYVTEGSFDTFMWQTLELKARFIGQVMTGLAGARRADDIGGQELRFAEVKAIASGNPAVLTLDEIEAELQRLALLKRSHADAQYRPAARPANCPRRSTGWRSAPLRWTPTTPPPRKRAAPRWTAAAAPTGPTPWSG